MKNLWWDSKAAELQDAADRHDTKSLYQELKAGYGPRECGCAPVKSLYIDGQTLTDRNKIIERWMEHFKSVLNQQFTFDEQVLSEIPQRPVASHLDEKPTTDEIQKVINHMSQGKASASTAYQQKSSNCVVPVYYLTYLNWCN